MHIYIHTFIHAYGVWLILNGLYHDNSKFLGTGASLKMFMIDNLVWYRVQMPMKKSKGLIPRIGECDRV